MMPWVVEPSRGRPVEGRERGGRVSVGGGGGAEEAVAAAATHASLAGKERAAHGRDAPLLSPSPLSLSLQ